MALTEIQIPQKEYFYRDVRKLANEIAGGMSRFKAAADFINHMTAADLDAMGVPSGQTRTDLVDMKNMLNELVSYFEGNTVEPVKTPADVIDRLRSMIIT